MGQELNVDVLLLGFDIVTEGEHRIGGRPARPNVSQGVPRARRDYAEVGVEHAAAGPDLPRARAAGHFEHACFLDARARAFGAIEQHPVQVEPGVDHQRLPQREPCRTRALRRQHRFADEPLGRVVLEQEGIAAISLVGQAPAAGFLPGQLVVKDDCLQAPRSQALGRECARGSASKHRYTLHLFAPEGAPELSGGWPGGSARPSCPPT